MEQNDILVNFRPTTEFEKMLFERALNKELIRQNKALKIEMGKLQSEKDELGYALTQEAARQSQIKPMRYQRRYELEKRRCHNLETRIRNLRKTNNNLICRIVKLEK